jgi:hypothetical protein
MVINSMPHHHLAGANRLGYLSQKVISHLSGCLLQRNMLLGLIALYVTRLYGSWNTKAVGYIRNIPGISLSLSPPQLVVKVSHMQSYPQFILKINQDVEQAD